MDTKTKRAEILRRACDVFARHGFDGASMSGIAAAAGLTKATLYHHFAGKEDLYVEIILSVLQRMCRDVAAAVADAPDAETRLRAFMHAHARFFEQHVSEVTASHYGLGAVRTSRKIDEITGWRDRYERILRDVLVEGEARGTFRKGEASVAGRMILSLLNEMPRWYRPAGKRSATQFADLYCDIVLNGLRPRG